MVTSKQLSLEDHRSGSSDIAADGGSRWERKLTGGKVNLPSSLQTREFLVIEPGAIEDHKTDRVYLYRADNPPEVHGKVHGEIRRALMTSAGQITLPRAFIEKSELTPNCHVFVRKSGDAIEIARREED
jgi:hypothetical protein